MNDISNKFALITGASRGIGKQVAYGLASKGCNLILHSRKVEHTDPLAAELKKTGVKVLQFEAELSNVELAKELAYKAEVFSGGIDILYNNAAIMTPYHEDYYSATVDEYELSFAVNVIAPIMICNIIIPNMLKRGFGRVINLSSGIKDEPELMPYAVSKAALDKFVKDFKTKLDGTNVLMNLLDPGWLKTDMGGDKAPNNVESVLPGALIPAMVDDVNGELFFAQGSNIA